MPKKAPEEPKPLSFATPNPWSALSREVSVGKGRGKKEGATTESPVDGQDQPKIYTIRDHTLEVLMHPDVLELHAVRVVHTPHGDERQLHLKVRVRCGQEELVVDVLVDTGAQVSLVRRGLLKEGSLQPSRRPVRLKVTKMSFWPEGKLFIDAKGVSMPSPGQALGTKAFLVDGAQAQTTSDEAFIRRVEAVPMKVMFEPKEGTDQPIDGIDVLSYAEIDSVVNYMRMGMHDRVAAKKRRAMVTSPHWWDDKMLVTGKYEKDEFVARVMDHIADQYDGPVGSDPPTWGLPRVGTGSDERQPEAANFRRLSVGIATHDDEDGILDEEKSDSDPEEAYTAVRSVVSIPRQAAEEAQENPKVAELKERLINAYPRLFSGVANKNPPDRGRFGTAKIKLKPNPKIYRHPEYQLQGDRAEAMKKLLAEFMERGWIEPSDSEWASPAFIVPKKEKGEWRLVVDYRGLNEQTEHDS